MIIILFQLSSSCGLIFGSSITIFGRNDFSVIFLTDLVDNDDNDDNGDVFSLFSVALSNL